MSVMSAKGLRSAWAHRVTAVPRGAARACDGCRRVHVAGVRMGAILRELQVGLVVMITSSLS